MGAYQTTFAVRNRNRFIFQMLFCMFLTLGTAKGSFAEDEGTSYSPDATARPVTINFDSLPTGVPLSPTQYPTATFTTNSGATIYTAYDAGYGGSYPNGIIAASGYGYSYYPLNNVYVNFALPVNGLSFRVLGTQSGGSSELVDVYVNNSYYTSIWFGSTPGYPGPYTVNLSSIQHITGISIRYAGNFDYLGLYYALYYDDFAFTPELSFNITNPRVSGNLDQMGTQHALAGAEVSLAVANATPANGSYSWTFTGSPTVTGGGVNQSAVTVRWTQTGTFRATMTYQKSGVSIQSFVDVAVILPSLTIFSATLQGDQVNRDFGCSNLPTPGATYTLACYRNGPREGIMFSAEAEIPQFNYLTDPAESGIKFVQAASVYRKRLRDGNTKCWTARTSPGDVNSGWQLDSGDPYSTDRFYLTSVEYFSSGNHLVISDFDSPGTQLDGTSNGVFFSDDARFVADNFEDYVFYFTTDPSNPQAGCGQASPSPSCLPKFQQALGLQNSSYPYAKLVWNWGGQATFNYFSEPRTLLYSLQSATTPTPIAAVGTNTVASMATTVTGNSTYTTCPGTTDTTNPIDSSRFFTKQLYLDFLNRPVGDDDDGMRFWRYNMTQCGFDTDCITRKRVDVARAFFYSTEFIGNHPELASDQRGTHDYNFAFVYACYWGFLQRSPTACPDYNWDGLNYWVNKLDGSNPDAGDWKYNDIIKAFLECPEYRNRFVPHSPCG